MKILRIFRSRRSRKAQALRMELVKAYVEAYRKAGKP